MNKGVIGFICGCLAGAALTMLYLHKDVLTACVKGEELPDAPDSCPSSKADCCQPEQAE